MKTSDNIRSEEQIISALRKLYESMGYSQFKMIKFEEYDFYVRNKDYLPSENIITFNDTNGKLMALKPDVTLSIIKNSPDRPDELNRVYYNENVYRVSKGTHNFKEIMQVGLECLGDIDSYVISEVLTLAVESLEMISDDCQLSISDLAVTAAAVDRASVKPGIKKEILRCIGEKSRHQLLEICEKENIDKSTSGLLCALATLHGKPGEVFDSLDNLLPGSAEVARLRKTVSALGKDVSDKIEIDFSFVDNINYYDGIVFKGFVKGIPNSVISGGQYNRLMEKMGKKSEAIGFAVYIDELERMFSGSSDYDTDTVVLYSKNTDIALLSEKIAALRSSGKRVSVMKKIPDKYVYGEIINLAGGEEK
ncbi:MAG: ATP phosphoribosyltransferase regulatory subunit [Clostridia bacterium]|nr:ATP phosphoribosyltransferase regulatory subunit [Clostridia bacterium]